MKKKVLARIGLLVVGVAVGAATVSWWDQPGATGKEVQSARVAPDEVEVASPPDGSEEEDTANCDRPEGEASEQAVGGKSNPAGSKTACPPALPTGFVDSGTPWEEIGASWPPDLLRDTGEAGLSLIKDLGSLLSSAAAQDGFNACGSHLRSPPGSKISTYKAEYVLDIEAMNGEARIVGSSVENTTYSDFQAERCFADVFRMNDRIELRDADQHENGYRIRVVWPVDYELPE